MNYYPELTGIGKYTGEMAEWLAAKGCQVTVVTAPPYYPAWKVAPGYFRFGYQREELNGVTIVRCPLWVPRHPSGVKRLLHLATFAISSFPLIIWHAFKLRPKLVFMVEPPLLCGFATLFAKRLAGGDAWLHIQDFEVDAAFSLGILKKNFLYRAVKFVEKWLMLRFDRVSTISCRMLEKLHAIGVPSAQQMLFENWVDLEEIRPLETASSFRLELNIPNDVTVLLYAGNMGQKQGLELAVLAARALSSRRDILFVLCGEGAVRAELEDMSTGYNNVKFMPLQPVDRLNELLNLADLHILPQRPGVEEVAMPSKLLNMLASGRPVIATATVGSPIATILRGSGGVVEPGDLDGFVGEIERFAHDAELRRRCGANGRAFALEHFGKESLLSKAFAHYLETSQRALAYGDKR